MRRCMIAALVMGCGAPADDVTVPPDVTDEDPPAEEPTLGDGTHDVTDALLVVGTAADGLDRPQDLAFAPDVTDELWVVSRNDDSVTRYDGAGTDNAAATHIVDPYALHFMEQVSSIAFGAPGTFATCQDSRNTYNGSSQPNNFMGPTLWTSDKALFGQSNPEAVEYLSDYFGQHVDLGSHLDMLHESPNCMGIAWDHDNVYWVFDGFHSAIVRYDFQEDHGRGYDDHSDGIIARWVEGQVSRTDGVPSHLVLDPESGLLYIADTGNDRIGVLDTTTGERGTDLPTVERGTQHYRWDGAEVRTLVNGNDLGMVQPSGIALVEGRLVVTDALTGRIHTFDLDGNELDWAETGRTALAGVFGRSLADLWVVDPDEDQILRLLP